MKEYRIESRYSDAGRWSSVTKTVRWKGPGGFKAVLQEWVRVVAQAVGTNWQYRIVAREVTEWEPIKNMDEALAILAEDASG